MQTVRFVLFQLHPYTLLLLGVCLAMVLVGAAFIVIRVVQFRRSQQQAAVRELECFVSGLSALARQGRVPPPLGTPPGRLNAAQAPPASAAGCPPSVQPPLFNGIEKAQIVLATVLFLIAYVAWGWYSLISGNAIIGPAS